MDSSRSRKEENKEIILRAALEFFKRYGFENVTIDEVARYASVSRATIYNNFDGKKGLVREVIKMLHQNLLEKYRSIIKGEGTFIQKLRLIVLDEIETLGHYQGELLTERVTRIDPEIQQSIESIWQREIDQLTIDLFNEGKMEGYVDPDLSDEVILAYCEILRRGLWASSNLVNISRNTDLTRELMTVFRYGLPGKTGHK